MELTIRAATPLALAALGEVLIERGSVINIGLEGSVLAGAFGAAVIARALGADAGVLGGALASSIIGALFAVFAVSLRINQVIARPNGQSRSLFGEQGLALTLPTLSPTAIPGFRSVPIVRSALFAQPYIVYFAVAVAIAMHWWMSRTRAGLALRAVGESRFAAIAAGIHPDRVHWFAILVGCAFAGLSGAVLVLAQAGTFVEGMSAGRGYITVAIVTLGRWRPLRTLLGACLFGANSALQFSAQALDWRLPYQLFLATPYLVTLAVLVVSARGSVPPAALGSSRDDM